MEFETEKKKMLEVYHRSKEQQYAFDKIFREETQEEVLTNTIIFFNKFLFYYRYMLKHVDI